MRVLGARELLAVWERGLRQPPLQRVLLLLEAATGEPVDALARLNIGQRDALLLELRLATFGAIITAVASCPACGETLELDFNVQEIQTAPVATQESITLEAAGYEVIFRLPNSLDMSAVDYSDDAEAARDLLLERCVLAVNGQSRNMHEIPPEVVDRITQYMSEADPQAEVELQQDCPACGHRWLTTFDILTYFWSELNGWAQCILREVHLLARYYGWREQDILDMSALRRQYYLQMVVGP